MVRFHQSFWMLMPAHLPLRKGGGSTLLHLEPFRLIIQPTQNAQIPYTYLQSPTEASLCLSQRINIQFGCFECIFFFLYWYRLWLHMYLILLRVHKKFDWLLYIMFSYQEKKTWEDLRDGVALLYKLLPKDRMKIPYSLTHLQSSIQVMSLKKCHEIYLLLLWCN